MHSLPTRPNFTEYEPRISAWWEQLKFYVANANSDKKPFTILLPPPNANAPLHAGHVLYVVEDILCRFKRMQGYETLFLPGTDHAGIETQYVLEKKLQKEGQSRFDFDRQTLYQLVDNFVEENRGIATAQLKRLGFSLDWSREKYTMDPKILETVLETFQQLHTDGLIYRDERLVNYCTHCGTGFSNLEINHKEREDSLYYINYQTITIATTRPETIFADSAIAVNPHDPRYANLIGKSATIPLINREIPVIADEAVEPDFGTGALKITPAHDHTDFEIGTRHQLERISVIQRDGKMTNVPSYLLDLYPKQARQETISQLESTGALVKTEPITHTVGVCYKCNNIIEPLLLPQWYIKVAPLIEAVTAALNNNEVRVFPDRFDKELRRWLETAPDWNISRQIVWGPQIPAWYNVEENPQIEVTFVDQTGTRVVGKYQDLKNKHSLNEIRTGLQSLIAPIDTPYLLNPPNHPDLLNSPYLQETDTFDTWFSSGQWPLTTLGYPNHPDFKFFYPTSVLDTMWDILPFWVMRMLMLGIYRTGKTPFQQVHLHSRVVDQHGQKMSKSRGNVINPMEYVEKYGADALRFSLISGIAPASDIPLGEEKLVGARNFITKLWNIGRFVLAQAPPIDVPNQLLSQQPLDETADQELLQQLNLLVESVTDDINQYQFSRALDNLYDFTWNSFASNYIEGFKTRSNNPQSAQALYTTLYTILKLLHPFIPFITEEIYQHGPHKTNSISILPWPIRMSTEQPTNESNY